MAVWVDIDNRPLEPIVPNEHAVGAGFVVNELDRKSVV